MYHYDQTEDCVGNTAILGLQSKLSWVRREKQRNEAYLEKDKRINRQISGLSRVQKIIDGNGDYDD